MSVLDLEVFVPSRSRWQRSLTLEALQGKWDDITLVVPAAQVGKYTPLARRHGVKLLPCAAPGIAGTRQFIGQRAKGHFLMLDDDLRFYRRVSQTDVHLHKLNRTDMGAMLIWVSRLLDMHAHVAISAREGNNRLDFPYITNSRPLRALAYRKAPFLKCVHGRVAVMEDFDVTLQLLSMGYQNAVITEYAQDQPGTQAPGGCSDYRTHALQAANVHKMVKLHPGLVKSRLKENKTGGGFGSRVEATIYWEKAHKQAMEEIL